MPSLGDILKSINQTKDHDLLDEYNISDYNPYIINRCLANFPDTILLAQEMNLNSGLERILQYKYYLYGVRERKRFSPWLKTDKDEKIELISKFYKYNIQKAKEVADLLSDEDMIEIKKHFYQGGKKAFTP